MIGYNNDNLNNVILFPLSSLFQMVIFLYNVIVYFVLPVYSIQ